MKNWTKSEKMLNIASTVSINRNVPQEAVDAFEKVKKWSWEQGQ